MKEAMEPCKQAAQFAVQQFLKTFSFVPDDKLNWAPAPTAKTALRVAAHVGLGLGAFTMMLRGEQMPKGTPEELTARFEAAESQITAREQAVALIEANLATVLAALDEMTPERLESVVETPFGSMCMRQIIFVPAMHSASHAAQIDYLQSIWGDTAFH